MSGRDLHYRAETSIPDPSFRTDPHSRTCIPKSALPFDTSIPLRSVWPMHGSWRIGGGVIAARCRRTIGMHLTGPASSFLGRALLLRGRKGASGTGWQPDFPPELLLQRLSDLAPPRWAAPSRWLDLTSDPFPGVSQPGFRRCASNVGEVCLPSILGLHPVMRGIGWRLA